MRAVRALSAQELASVDRSKVVAMRWVLTRKQTGAAKARLVVLQFQAHNLLEVETAAPDSTSTTFFWRAFRTTPCTCRPRRTCVGICGLASGRAQLEKASPSGCPCRSRSTRRRVGAGDGCVSFPGSSSEGCCDSRLKAIHPGHVVVEGVPVGPTFRLKCPSSCQRFLELQSGPYLP